MEKKEHYTRREALEYLAKQHDYIINISTLDHQIKEATSLKSIKLGSKRLFTADALDYYAKNKNINRINKRAEVIAFANHKGGVGKTMSVLNIVGAFAKFYKHKILVIDFDPQANLSASYDVNLKQATTIDEVIMNGVDINNAIIQVNEFIDLVPSYRKLCDFDLNPKTTASVNNLSDAIDTVKGDYDFIFIDCPPQISNLTYSAILSADHLFIPMCPDMYSVDGLLTFLDYAKSFNEDIIIQGVFITKFASSQVVDNEYKELLAEEYPDLLMKSIVRKNIALSEAVIYKKNIFEYKRKCSGFIDYKLLAKEIYNKLGYR